MKNFLIIALLIMANVSQAQRIKYPKTNKQSVKDNYFGTEIMDPYRWLEDDTSIATANWVREQNVVTQNYLSQIPFRDHVKDELTKMWNYAKYSSPFKKGSYYYFYKNDGLQNQAVLYRQKGLDATPEIFIDPNKLSPDGTISLGDLSFSSNAKLVSYTTSQSGSDWQDIYVMDVETKTLLADKINYTKFGGVTWLGDHSFYYSGYDKPSDEATKYSAKSEFQKIFFHKIGTPQNADKIIFDDPEHPLLYKWVGLTEDERFLILSLSQGTDGTEIQYMDLKDKKMSKFKQLLPGYKYNYSIIDNIGDKLILYTNEGASNYQLVLLDPKKPSFDEWEVLIPEVPEKLDNVSIIGKQLFLQYLQNASTIVKRYDMKGKFLGDLSRPGIGTLTGFGGKSTDLETFYSYASFNMPVSIYRYDITTNRSTLFKSPDLNFKPDDYIITQMFYPSKDGVMVPMFVVHHKNTNIDAGNNPVFLYGYGGFNISLTPNFSVPNLYFIKQGGIYCMVNLRGGSEYGEEWHSGGMLSKKQNVFDDFIAAAEFLIKKNITTKDKIAIHGRSNGGLLVGACMTQRPDLFKVALPGVGVLDMLRYHKFTVGWGWAVEYGSSEKQEDFNYLIKYSPLHNLKNGTNYPATLITTADHDDRVVPAHSFKYAATLQENHKGENPVLIRIDAKAGHGAGKPTSKQIDEWADILSFTMYNLKMKPMR